MGHNFEESLHNGRNEVLLYGDHHVKQGIFLPQASAAEPGLAVLVKGRYIVKAGTIYPSNDEYAKGVIANDVDLTDSDRNASLIIHGVIHLARLPEAPEAGAIDALKLIQFV